MKGFTRWYKHCKTQEEKVQVQAALSEAQFVFRILDKLIQEDLRVTYKEKITKESYKDPSWAYHQADKNGEIRAYTKILKLIKDFT